MNRPIVLLDNGHGWDTPGKRSPDASKGLLDSPYYFREYKWTREIAQRGVSVLSFMNYDARLLVPEENDISLPERVARVNKVCNQYGAGNVILISIHNNASQREGWGTANGWECYTTRGITKADKLASCLYDAAEATFKAPQTIRYEHKYDKLGRDREKDFYIIRHTYCPAVLIENFFQDNKSDVLYLNSDNGKGDCLDVICSGIETYCSTI